MKTFFKIFGTIVFLALQAISLVISLMTIYITGCLLLGYPASFSADTSLLIFVSCFVDLFNAFYTLIWIARRRG